MPSIGIGIGIGRGGGVPFTPGSYAGLVLDVAIGPSWCFTDTAGTTPAGIGDTVKCVTDRKSGLQFIQVAAKSTDRTLQQDASGKYYLSLGGGTNDWLQCTSPPSSLNNTAGVCVGLACRMTSVSAAGSDTPLALGDSVGSVSALMHIKLYNLVLPNWAVYTGFGGVGIACRESGAAPLNTDCRLLGRYDTSPSKLLQLWDAGVQTASLSTGTTTPGTTGNLVIGANGRGTGNYFTGRIYGFVVYVPDLSDAQCSVLDTYLKGLMP